MSKMRVLDTFSGIGAFSEAALSIDAEIIAHVEIDKNCQKLLATRYPQVKQLGDICNVKKEHIKGTVDLLCGGSPCQNLSIAGNRQGLAGTESRLWFEYLRLAQELNPTWIVWENVPNALSSNDGRDFRTILMGLDECGYHVAWRVLDAQYFGVPQRRRRIFLVGHLGDGRAAQVLFERESHSGNSKTTPDAWKSGKVVGTLAGSGAGTARPAGQTNEGDFIVFGKSRSNDYRESAISLTLTEQSKKDSAMFVAHKINHETGKIEEFSIINRDGDDFRKGHTPQALTKQNNSTYIHQNILRRLTPLECERLQGFPDNWTEGFSDATRYGLLGNSIAIPVVKWVFKRIAEVNND